MPVTRFRYDLVFHECIRRVILWSNNSHVATRSCGHKLKLISLDEFSAKYTTDVIETSTRPISSRFFPAILKNAHNCAHLMSKVCKNCDTQKIILLT